MNDRQRIQLALVAGERLALLAKALDAVGRDGRTVLGRLRDAQGPLRGRSYEAPSSSGRSDGTPAGAFHVDPALAAERDLDEALRLAGSAAVRLWTIVSAYPPPHHADAAERRRLGLGDGPWCSSCARTAGGDGAPRREPIRSDLAGPTDVGGRLDQHVVLCSWCYGCVRDWSRLPTVDEVRRHHDVGRVPWPADVERPA